MTPHVTWSVPGVRGAAVVGVITGPIPCGVILVIIAAKGDGKRKLEISAATENDLLYDGEVQIQAWVTSSPGSSRFSRWRRVDEVGLGGYKRRAKQNFNAVLTLFFLLYVSRKIRRGRIFWRLNSVKRNSWNMKDQIKRN